MPNRAESDTEHLADDLSACSLMFPNVFLASLRMATGEATIARGYALEAAGKQDPSFVVGGVVVGVRWAGRRGRYGCQTI